MRKSPMLLSIASATMISIAGCSSAPAVPDFCAIQSDVVPDPGFQTRWTRAEKAQIEKLDEHLDEFCHRRP